MFQKIKIVLSICLTLLILLFSGLAHAQSMDSPNIGGLEIMQAVKGHVSYLGCNYTENFKTDTALGSGNNRVLQSAICWMEDVSASLGVGMALGSTFIKMGTDDFWDAFMTIIIGICIFLSFFIIYLMFPLKLLNAFVRLGFIFALMPLWIILWVFPITAGYTKKAWDAFIGTLFFFISLSIIISLILILMNQSIQPDSIRTEIFQLMVDGNTSEAANRMEFGRTFFTTLAFGLMSFSLLGTAETLSNMFASAPSLGLDKAMLQNAAPVYNITKKVGGTIIGGTLALAGKKTEGTKGTGGGSKPASLGFFKFKRPGSQPPPSDQPTGQPTGQPSPQTPPSDQPTGQPSPQTPPSGQPDGQSGSQQPTNNQSNSNQTDATPNAETNSNERYLAGVKTAERIHKSTAGLDKQTKNDFCQRSMNQFFEEQANKGITYSDKEQKALFELSKGATSQKETKKVFKKSMVNQRRNDGEKQQNTNQTDYNSAGDNQTSDDNLSNSDSSDSGTPDTGSSS